MNAPHDLHATGQRLWLDNITKDLIDSGTLARYIDDLHVTGVTSNPTILQKAISAGNDYDDAIRSALAERPESTEALIFTIALQDLVAAADLLRGVFDASGGADGYVSVEVSPDLADDAEGTVVAGQELFFLADRPNVMIKVPGTAAGLVAVEELISVGIPVNVTLLFSTQQYEAAAEAYLRGIERRLAESLPLPVGSVASVFVSRWDAAADPLLPAELVSTTALAVMRQVYASYQRVLASERWRLLAEAGALPQKVLWASTGTKNPDLPDTFYVGRLAAPGTVDTIPEPTLLAFADHGDVDDLLDADTTGSDAVLVAVEAAGVDVTALGARLQLDGAAAFWASWADLVACVQGRVDELRAVAR